MFFKGFICGWVGMAAIIMFLIWGMTPRVTGTEFGYKQSDDTGYENCVCEVRDAGYQHPDSGASDAL